MAGADVDLDGRENEERHVQRCVSIITHLDEFVLANASVNVDI